MRGDDYARIERAILYLEETVRIQPRLADVAQHVGLSEYHFQRLFRRWAGVSPKRFLQFLTAEHAKRLLDSSRSLLDVIRSTGAFGGYRWGCARKQAILGWEAASLEQGAGV